MFAFSAVLSSLNALFIVTLPVLALATPSPESFPSLSARQTNGNGLFDPSTIPSTCQSTCTSVENNLDGCSDLPCLCSTTVIQGITSCLDCGVGIKGSPLNITYAQNLINTYINSCNQGGVNVSPVTIKGSAGGSSAGGNSATPTAAISGAALVAIVLILTFAST